MSATVENPRQIHPGDAGLPSTLLLKIIEDAKAEFGESLVAILVTGSRVAGAWRSSSDLDLHIIHSGAWYQKRFIAPEGDYCNVPLDIWVDPLYALYQWILNDRVYAQFFASGLIIYPETIPDEIEIVVRAATRIFQTPRRSGLNSDTHYLEYRHVRRVLDRAIVAGDNDQRSSLAYAGSSISLLRLFLSGEYHPKHYALATQLRELDPAFFERLDTCLKQRKPREGLLLAQLLLEELRPGSDSWTGQNAQP